MDQNIQSKIDLWLDSNIDSQDKEILRRLVEDGNADELNDSFYKDLEFGTGGLRGVMGIGTNRMNKYTVGMATQGLSNYLNQEFAGEEIKVAIAHDSRNNSSKFAQIVADVFSANGFIVYLFDELRPTPELSFAIRHLGCKSGVVITASHNPREYNGFKAYWSDGAQITPPHDKNIIDEVRKIESIDEVKFDSNAELIKKISTEVDEPYLEMLEGLSLSPEAIQNQANLSIVFSPIHGTGITMVPKILERLGFNNVHVIDEQSKPDGDFPTVVYPNPEEQEAMTLALTKAREIDADLVMATDPDSDRVGIAIKNRNGEFELLNGNQTGAILIYYLCLKWKENNKLDGNQYIVKTIVTTELIREIAEHFGIESYDTLTGFKWIAKKIAELEGKKTFIGGGEESYGYMIGESVRDKDAVASCAIIAEMAAWAADQGKGMIDILDEIHSKFGMYRESLISITKKGQSGAEEIQAMMRDFRSNPPKSLGSSEVAELIDYQEGLKKDLISGDSVSINYPKSNVLQFLTKDGSKVSVRPSGTEPKIKFYFSVKASSGSTDSIDLTWNTLGDKINNIQQELNLN